MTRHGPIVVRALTWNLFHGRDSPPDASLFTWRSRLLRVTERNATHAQVNRPLFAEFATVLGRDPWNVALLQEAPPRWLRPLRRSLGAAGARSLTSRNRFGLVRACAAALNPDLVASNEGGSNQLLVRPPFAIRATRELTLTVRPERRVMQWALIGDDEGRALAVANLHASTDPIAAAEEIERAAARAVEWAAGAPLVFGGDLNVRPARSPAVFEELRRRHALAPPTPGDAIDHLLARGVEIVEPPHAVPPGWREVPERGGRLLRLSDHAAVAARFGVR